MVIPEQLKSRKFLLAILLSVGCALLAAAGKIDWIEALNRITVILGAYIGVEGAADALRANNEIPKGTKQTNVSTSTTTNISNDDALIDQHKDQKINQVIG